MQFLSRATLPFKSARPLRVSHSLLSPSRRFSEKRDTTDEDIEKIFAALKKSTVEGEVEKKEEEPVAWNPAPYFEGWWAQRVGTFEETSEDTLEEEDEEPVQQKDLVLEYKPEESLEELDRILFADLEEGDEEDEVITDEDTLDYIDMADVLDNELDSVEEDMPGDDRTLDIFEMAEPKEIEDQFSEMRGVEGFDKFPAQVRRWILDAKIPRGFYSQLGDWLKESDFDDVMIGSGEERLKFQPSDPNEEKERVYYGKPLPEDLRGQYRFGILPEEVEGLSVKLKDILSFRHASNAEILKFRTQKAIERFGRENGDTGSPEVQIAVNTERILSLTAHLKNNRQDFRTDRAMRKLVAQRRTMMKYLKRKDVAAYYKVLKAYNLRDVA